MCLYKWWSECIHRATTTKTETPCPKHQKLSTFAASQCSINILTESNWRLFISIDPRSIEENEMQPIAWLLDCCWMPFFNFFHSLPSILFLSLYHWILLYVLRICRHWLNIGTHTPRLGNGIMDTEAKCKIDVWCVYDCIWFWLYSFSFIACIGNCCCYGSQVFIEQHWREAGSGEGQQKKNQKKINIKLHAHITNQKYFSWNMRKCFKRESF